MKTDVIVIGAGASGLMCALEAGKRGRSVLILEHTPRIGSKIRVSGGGRCNFTNMSVGREHYLSENPHFAASALARYTPSDFIALVEKHGIGYQVREAGQLFCAGSAQQVVEMLQAECVGSGARFIMDCRILEIAKEGCFSVSTSRETFESASLVVATGGLSAPNLGATNVGYSIARQFGIHVTPLRPALTPLRFSRGDAEVFTALSGISFDAAVSHGSASFQGNVLFTHRGLSGPAILQISSYWDGNSPIVIDLLPGVDIHRVLLENRQSRMHLATLLGRFLPGRLVKLWCERNLKSAPLNQVSPRQLDALAESLHHWEIRPARTEGFNKAEVTSGGVSTSELSSKTMEAKKVSGLYFTGEVIDVTGHLGGYNLHWAWASGYAAGQVV
jgi:predicted Rossmann fold flavoprotein